MTYLVGVAGGSGSGKGTITELVKQHLELWDLSCHVLSTDDCYRDLSHLTELQREELCFNPEKNYDHPSSVNFERLATFSSRLQQGEPFAYQTYNFKSHTYDDESKTIAVDPTLDVGIVEGNYALYSGAEVGKLLLNLYDHSLFVTTNPNIAMARRIRRDINERGRDLEHVLDQMVMTVIPMYEKFIFPTRLDAADVVDWHVGPFRQKFDVKRKLISTARQRARTIYEGVKGVSESAVLCELDPDSVSLSLPESARTALLFAP
jgi:uridine kinase